MQKMEMERDIYANTLYEEFSILKDRSGLNAIKCKGGQNGFYVCFQSQCKNYPFMCPQKTCLCKKDHEKCFKSLLQDFLDKFQSKVVDHSYLIQQNYKMINVFVKKIAEQAEKMKKIIRAQVLAKSKTLSFNAEELQMLTSLQKNDVKNLKGKDFYRIYLQMEKKQKQQNNEGIYLKNQLKNGFKIWTELFKVIIQKLNLIQKMITNNKHGLYEEKRFQLSKIAITTKENYDLKNFFAKQIRKTQLLYRASQNQFKLKGFKDTCYGIPNTLTLIETQYGKKVGGFTPLVWMQTQKETFTADPSNKTFIFSLTQNQKFLPIDNTNSGIYNIPSHGSTFGNSNFSDICICQSANNSKNSLISFNQAYKNPKFNQLNQQNLLKFNGSPINQQQVKIKQWQIWKVTFQQ